MILFLYGADSYRSRQQMNKMIAKFQADRDPSRLNVIIPEVGKASVSDIVQEIHSAPFLAEKRMVVLKSVLGSKDKELQAVLLEKIKEEKIPASTILLLWEDGADFKSTNLVKELFALLQKEKYAQCFDIVSGLKLQQVIEEQVKEFGGTIDRDALQYLANNSKNDMWFVQSTIEQLTAFASGRSIALADVKEFVPERFDDNIFNLVDAIVAGQGGKVFAMLEEQYKKGEDAMFVLSMLIRQFRILLELRDLVERNIGGIEGLAKDMGLHPFVVKKSLPFAKKYSFAQLQKIYSALLDLDIKTKTGGGDQPVLLDIFVAGLVT